MTKKAEPKVFVPAVPRIRKNLVFNARDRAKIRMIDLLARVEFAKAAGVTGALARPYTKDDVEFGIHFQIETDDQFFEWHITQDCEDYVFEEIEKHLDKVCVEHDEERARIKRRNDALRDLSPQQREALGFATWRDNEQ